MQKLRLILVVPAIALAALAEAEAAHAAFPGANGDIAFTNEPECDSEGWEVWIFDPGSGNTTGSYSGKAPAYSPEGTRLAFAGPFSSQIYVQTIGGGVQAVTDGGQPAWSPDDQRLAFHDQFGGGLSIINVDGTGRQLLVPGGGHFLGGSPRWSPDGSRIAFSARLDGETDNEIYVVRVANGVVTKLTDNGADDVEPDWSPGGGQLTFGRLASFPGTNSAHVMNASGGGETAALATNATGPTWSPDGTRIAFARGADHIDSMAADGSDQQVEFDATGYCVFEPDWQPLPVNTPSRYPRPKGATPSHLPLVTAFKACTAPNRTHGPPLEHPSCNPPQPASPNLVLSSGESRLRAIGSVILNVHAGVPGGPDDADVRLRFSLTNVMHASTFADYTGELRPRLGVRRTDREGQVASTTQDFPLQWAVPCSASSDPAVGATCALDTTLDTLVPGAAAEGTRAIWALDQLRVDDGGADGDADTEGDNSLFATQGIFVP